MSYSPFLHLTDISAPIAPLTATPALGVPSGKRSAIVGFILEACKVLLACCDVANKDSIYNANVARLLRVSCLCVKGFVVWSAWRLWGRVWDALAPAPAPELIDSLLVRMLSSIS
jgi:hypothetical protein